MQMRQISRFNKNNTPINLPAGCQGLYWGMLSNMLHVTRWCVKLIVFLK